MPRRPNAIGCSLALLVCAGVVTQAGEPASVSEAFVTNQTDDSLSIVELGDLKVAETLKIGGKPAGIAVSADGKLAFLTSPEGKEVVVVDAVARKIVQRIKIGEGPLGIAAHPSNGRIYVACWFDNVLMRIDTDKLEVEGEAAVGDGPRAFGLFLR